MKNIYSPEQLKIADERMKPFIDSDEIHNYLKDCIPTDDKVEEIVNKSLSKKRLTMAETAYLLNANSEKQVAIIKSAAKELKERVYGKRIVLFAPLYVGNYCTNNCEYCGFKSSNKEQKRSTLSEHQLRNQVQALIDEGQKRLILVFGEHPQYSPEFIARSVEITYHEKHLNGEIRRVNINAAPFDVEGFKTVKDVGIGTYQIFQETYHKETYAKVHKGGKKSDYDWRLTSLDRAQEAGIDDVGIGALFGLYDWRFEVMGLVRHVNHFEAVYNVGPHTISFPRITEYSGSKIDDKYKVSDEDFTKLVAVLRLAVPYTGLILTAREPMHIREEVLKYGVSQIDGGTNIQMGGYSEKNDSQDLNKEQFKINDDRPLNEVMDELVDTGYIPSFCTACYRVGRTGEHFMEFSVPGFIKRFCQPNAVLTYAEYLEDYASEEQKAKGYKMINDEIANSKVKDQLQEKLDRIKKGERDLYF